MSKQKEYTSYNKWLNFLDPQFQYFLYVPEKLFFGRKLKDRLKRKWHHRYIRTRNKKYKQQGLSKDICYCLYFGRVVYSYHNNEIQGFTAKPKQESCRSFPLVYAIYSKKLNNGE